MYKSLQTDVLVIGGGLAGCRAAIAAGSRGYKSLLICGSKPGHSGNSSRASGGFATAIGPADSPSIHSKDIQSSGYDLSDRSLVEQITSLAAERFLELAEIAPDFIRTEEQFVLHKVPVHSQIRSIQYSLGMAHLMTTLGRECESQGVEIKTANHALYLLNDENGNVAGAQVFDSRHKQEYRITAKSVVIASGGCAPLYPVNSNDPTLCGSSYALALMAGCKLRDMEFIQFTPTAFAFPDSLKGHTIVGTLLTLPGVTLTNCHGERFMQKYDTKLLEQSDRATLARSIHREVMAGGGSEQDGVYLDLRSVPIDVLDQHRPGFLELCKSNGIDPQHDLLQTAPSAHTCLGGIVVDLTMQAKVGLFAAGEAIGGLHGANRLASNSLMEANVTGWIAGQSAADYASQKPSSNSLTEQFEHNISCTQNNPHTAQNIRRTMGNYVGVSRDASGLEKAKLELEKIMKAEASSSEPSTAANHQLHHMLMTASAVVQAALLRKESRGAHYRSDFPKQDDKHWTGNQYSSLLNEKLETSFKLCKTE
ncbi:MAG: fumarate reductase (CoM/CoB) subunit A [Parasphingorhabdus sp.]|jgi:fumarate reductase (CoM/CoB) subunit A